MVFTQKYNSILDVEEEYIQGLEDLLQDQLPSFKWLVDFEKQANKNIHFAYYLFFGNRQNTPIGFAQLQINKKDLSEKKSFFGFNKKPSSNTVSWTIPGISKEGITFQPMYEKECVAKATDIIKEFSEREDIKSQKLICPVRLKNFNNELSSKENQVNEKEYVVGLLKNKNSYENYLADLDHETKSSIMGQWKNLHKKHQIHLGNYNSFKDIFRNRKDGSTFYVNLKKDPEIAPFIHEEINAKVCTLETQEKISAIVFLIPGKNHHLFYHFVILDNTFGIDEKFMHQFAITCFYDNESSQYLHYFKSDYYSEDLLNFGHICKKQLTMNIDSNDL